MITRDSFTVEEWAQIISAPATVGALVVTADPSGPLGLLGEFRAIMDSMKTYVEAHAADSPLIGALKEYISTRPSAEEEAQLKQWADNQQAEMKANRPQTPEEMRTLVRERLSATMTLLQTKGATDADVHSFKDMMYAIAEGVANASKEGGFLGFGGQRVSDREAAVLTELKSELGV